MTASPDPVARLMAQKFPPGAPASQLGDIGQDDSNRSDDDDETSEGALGNFDLDKFKSSDEEDLSGEMRDGQSSLKFELRAVKAGNVLCRLKILTKN